uniref:Lacticin 481/lactococcin biosynthesis protein LCNDR2 n=2 Tax=Lactococcus lactis TaxID=1358 RepID=O87238_9LACT|nr:type 2 lanthipeptide synthetase LanM [Lactococcus lactis]AAC56011.1 lacticin 481/lactococcin biosynthesis protein LCNDR2 [Lactococcus lactis]
MKFNKNVFPEINETDFDNNIKPLLDELESRITIPQEELSFSSINDDLFRELTRNEEYPYQSICTIVANIVMDDGSEIWRKDIFVDSNSVREAVCDILSQTLFLYFIRCFSEQIKDIRKTDEDKESTYNRYINLLFSSNFKIFSDEYPVLWYRTIRIIKNRWYSIKKSLLLTQKHRVEIDKQLDIPHKMKIKGLKIGGDTHNGGATVTTIFFEKGYKLIYKPRSTSGEFSYKKFIEKINPYLKKDMGAIKAIDFGEYGFSEYIECNTDEEDMKQVGQLAFFMYLLNASDMHYSNVIWTKQGPVPIDLETLFQPDRIRKGLKQSETNAYHKMEKSVYGTGIIPISLSVKGKKGEVDVGFSGIRDERSSSPFRVLEILDGFSSDIKIVWKKQQKSSSSKNNLIVDHKKEREILQRAQSVVEGFQETSKIFMKHREEFISIILDSFENIKIRYIHNMTFRYEQLLRTLTDAEPAQKIELDRLLLSRTGILSISSSPYISLSECQQMWQGDVPYFYSKFSSKSIFDTNGFVDEIELTPRQAFIIKAESITNDEVDFQSKIIKLAFMARLSDPHTTNDNKLNKKVIIESNQQSNSSESGNKAILFLSDLLKNNVLEDRYSHLPKTWIGPVARDGGLGWAPGVLGYDLYSGRTGPALALAAAGRVLKDKDSIELSADIFNKSSQILQEKTYDFRNLFASGIGGFSGITGLFWALNAAGNILNNDDWIKTSNQSMLLLNENMLKVDKNFFDLISGNSGAIGMMYLTNPNFYLSRSKINDILLTTDCLITEMEKDETSGLAHGVSQILWFLSIMMQRQPSSEIKIRATIVDNIIKKKYTNSYGEIECYYPTDGHSKSTSWCNGTSGILVAYIEGYKANIVDKSSVYHIINQINVEQLQHDNIPIMCHGSLGVYESLKYASKYFEIETKYLLDVMRNGGCSSQEVLKYYGKGNGRYPLSPGLMAGQSGALLHCCKLEDNDISVSPISLMT